MADLGDLDKEINQIKARNKRVETDKAWEGSYTRKALLSIFTYLAMGLYMDAIGIDKWWLNAIIPTLGFLLSTLTLPFFKNIWVKYIQK